MHIEMLWLIPAIGFASFIFIVIFNLQRYFEQRRRESSLVNEVARFNSGSEAWPSNLNPADPLRLSDAEKAINSIAESLARQSQLQPQKGGHGSENEIKDLKEKLRTVFKEYDIVLSENYSLRAKVKHLTRQLRDPDKADLHDMPDADSHMTITPEVSKPALHLYDDTRLITIAAMDTDDQSESTDAIAR